MQWSFSLESQSGLNSQSGPWRPSVKQKIKWQHVYVCTCGMLLCLCASDGSGYRVQDSWSYLLFSLCNGIYLLHVSNCRQHFLFNQFQQHTETEIMLNGLLLISFTYSQILNDHSGFLDQRKEILRIWNLSCGLGELLWRLNFQLWSVQCAHDCLLCVNQDWSTSTKLCLMVVSAILVQMFSFPSHVLDFFGCGRGALTCTLWNF